MTTPDEIRLAFEKESKLKWFTNPVCHGEWAYASWDYQRWLETKLLESPQLKQPYVMVDIDKLCINEFAKVKSQHILYDNYKLGFITGFNKSKEHAQPKEALPDEPTYDELCHKALKAYLDTFGISQEEHEETVIDDKEYREVVAGLMVDFALPLLKAQEQRHDELEDFLDYMDRKGIDLYEHMTEYRNDN
jgi:hypothetical protein